VDHNVVVEECDDFITAVDDLFNGEVSAEVFVFIVQVDYFAGNINKVVNFLVGIVDNVKVEVFT